jgi:signal transduction histidine kinase
MRTFKLSTICALAVAGSVGFALLGVTYVYVQLTVLARAQETTSRATAAMEIVAEELVPFMPNPQRAQIEPIVGKLLGRGGIRFVRVVDINQRPVYESFVPRDAPRLDMVEVHIAHGIERLGRIQAAVDRTPVKEEVQRVVVMGLVILAVMVSGGAALGYVIGSKISDLLADLTEKSRKAHTGELHPQAARSHVAEAHALTSAMLELVDQTHRAQAKMHDAVEHLARVKKEMAEFTYVISHDLKEPLRGIEAFSKFLVDDYSAKLDEEGRHRLDVIHKSALRMQRLIMDLLKFSRLTTKQNPFQLIGMNALLLGVRANLSYALEAKNVDLRVGDLPRVMCDPIGIAEVFHNLISNAIKYNNKPNPIIEIGCAEKKTESGQVYEFYVKDNGEGIKPEHQEKIFQIFQRLHRDEEGTGIGLTIVKHVVEAHGGRIWVQSQHGEGTTFFFTLPAHTPPEPAEAEKKSASHG